MLSATHMSSSGEMKMSLNEMTFARLATQLQLQDVYTHVLMSKVFKQFEFSVCAFRQDRCRKRFHDLLHRDRLLSQLIFGGAAFSWLASSCVLSVPGSSYHTRPNAPMPTGCRSVYLIGSQSRVQVFDDNHAYLLVISKVVPKI